MIGSVAEQIVGEMRSHPFTLLVVLALLAFAAYAHQNHASGSEIQKISEQVGDNTKKIDKVLQLAIAESLRNLQNQLCSAEHHESERTLQKTIDELQAEYRSITGERYPLQACD